MTEVEALYGTEDEMHLLARTQKVRRAVITGVATDRYTLAFQLGQHAKLTLSTRRARKKPRAFKTVESAMSCAHRISGLTTFVVQFLPSDTTTK